MLKISLKDWVILLTIIPTTLIGFSLAGYFSYTRHVELNEFIELRAKSVIEPLAIASEFPLTNKNRHQLRKLINFVHRSQSDIVESIIVFTADNQMFVTSAYLGNTNKMRLHDGEKISSFTQSKLSQSSSIIRSPIIVEQGFSHSNLKTVQDTDLSSASTSSIDISSTQASSGSKPIVIGYVAIQLNTSKIELSNQSQLLTAFIIALFGSLISAIFAIKLIRNVTKPVSAMVNTVDRIREGRLESRVNGQLVGELNFLKNGINAMAESLITYQNEMQGSIDQATVDLRNSLELFEIQNVELTIANKKAQDANRVKSEFLANMSHELRTPLNGVIGFTRQVLKTPLSDVQRDYLQTIYGSANNLLNIINDILDFSKLDAGKMILEELQFSLRHSLEDALTLLSTLAHNKNIELSLHIDEGIPDALIGDTMRIKQVMSNLVGNALKFTDHGNVCIDITIVHKGNENITLKITVTDSGIGITKQQQETIFNAFSQADQSITRLYGGTGLGLVISQRIAKEMHGDIGFISDENKGSTFWFTFECKVNKAPSIIVENDYLDILKDKSILYFEPHQHSNFATTQLLNQWNMKVTSVSNESELDNELAGKGVHFDFALIGHNDDSTALGELKKIITQVKRSISSVHVALNTTSLSLQDALLANGATTCITKPMTMKHLTNSLCYQSSSLEHQMQKGSPPAKKLNIKVLAVDDNKANLKLINALLLEQVDEVILASSGIQALSLCEEQAFSLIFMDIQMPVMDGITTLNAIKSGNNKNINTPIIAVTAHALNDEKQQMKQKGFSAYMTKPIDETMLRHIIFEYCPDAHIKGQAVHIPKVATHTITSSDTQNGVNDNFTVIDWPLALKRTNKSNELAKEMLTGLIDCLNENKSLIVKSIEENNMNDAKKIIHMINGACCYCGVPLLEKICHRIETQLKYGKTFEQLEPEFFEFWDEFDKVIDESSKFLKT